MTFCLYGSLFWTKKGSIVPVVSRSRVVNIFKWHGMPCAVFFDFMLKCNYLIYDIGFKGITYSDLNVYSDWLQDRSDNFFVGQFLPAFINFSEKSRKWEGLVRVPGVPKVMSVSESVLSFFKRRSFFEWFVNVFEVWKRVQTIYMATSYARLSTQTWSIFFAKFLNYNQDRIFFRKILLKWFFFEPIVLVLVEADFDFTISIGWGYLSKKFLKGGDSLHLFGSLFFKYKYIQFSKFLNVFQRKTLAEKGGLGDLKSYFNTLTQFTIFLIHGFIISKDKSFEIRLSEMVYLVLSFFAERCGFLMFYMVSISSLPIITLNSYLLDRSLKLLFENYLSLGFFALWSLNYSTLNASRENLWAFINDLSFLLWSFFQNMTCLSKCNLTAFLNLNHEAISEKFGRYFAIFQSCKKQWIPFYSRDVSQSVLNYRFPQFAVSVEDNVLDSNVVLTNWEAIGRVNFFEAKTLNCTGNGLSFDMSMILRHSGNFVDFFKNLKWRDKSRKFVYRPRKYEILMFKRAFSLQTIYKNSWRKNMVNSVFADLRLMEAVFFLWRNFGSMNGDSFFRMAQLGGLKSDFNVLFMQGFFCFLLQLVFILNLEKRFFKLIDSSFAYPGGFSMDFFNNKLLVVQSDIWMLLVEKYKFLFYFANSFFSVFVNLNLVNDGKLKFLWDTKMRKAYFCILTMFLSGLFFTNHRIKFNMEGGFYGGGPLNAQSFEKMGQGDFWKYFSNFSGFEGQSHLELEKIPANFVAEGGEGSVVEFIDHSSLRNVLRCLEPGHGLSEFDPLLFNSSCNQTLYGAYSSSFTRRLFSPNIKVTCDLLKMDTFKAVGSFWREVRPYQVQAMVKRFSLKSFFLSVLYYKYLHSRVFSSRFLSPRMRGKSHLTFNDCGILGNSKLNRSTRKHFWLYKPLYVNFKFNYKWAFKGLFLFEYPYYKTKWVAEAETRWNRGKEAFGTDRIKYKFFFRYTKPATFFDTFMQKFYNDFLMKMGFRSRFLLRKWKSFLRLKFFKKSLMAQYIFLNKNVAQVANNLVCIGRSKIRSFAYQTFFWDNLNNRCSKAIDYWNLLIASHAITPSKRMIFVKTFGLAMYDSFGFVKGKSEIGLVVDKLKKDLRIIKTLSHLNLHKVKNFDGFKKGAFLKSWYLYLKFLRNYRWVVAKRKRDRVTQNLKQTIFCEWSMAWNKFLSDCALDAKVKVAGISTFYLTNSVIKTVRNLAAGLYLNVQWINHLSRCSHASNIWALIFGMESSSEALKLWIFLPLFRNLSRNKILFILSNFGGIDLENKPNMGIGKSGILVVMFYLLILFFVRLVFLNSFLNKIELLSRERNVFCLVSSKAVGNHGIGIFNTITSFFSFKEGESSKYISSYLEIIGWGFISAERGFYRCDVKARYKGEELYPVWMSGVMIPLNFLPIPVQNITFVLKSIYAFERTYNLLFSLKLLKTFPGFSIGLLQYQPARKLLLPFFLKRVWYTQVSHVFKY